MTGKDNLPEKVLLKKASTTKKFEYSPLGKQLKAQTDNAKKKYQKLDNTLEFDKIIKSELMYNSKYSFYNYRNGKKINNLSLKSQYSFLVEFFNDLNGFNQLKI